MERKIIINSCRDCPFCDWENPEWFEPYRVCKKYKKAIRSEIYYDNEIEIFCMLPVNIPTSKFNEE